MDAKDLMIGDWTQKREGDHFVNVQVLGVIDNLVTYLCGSTEGTITANGIEPIPITSEILEKNGFEWDSYHKQFTIVCGTIHIGWGFYKNCLSISDWSDDGDSQISSIRCVYVHELQHAIRVCGINKEIVL